MRVKMTHPFLEEKKKKKKAERQVSHALVAVMTISHEFPGVQERLEIPRGVGPLPPLITQPNRDGPWPSG